MRPSAAIISARKAASRSAMPHTDSKSALAVPETHRLTVDHGRSAATAARLTVPLGQAVRESAAKAHIRTFTARDTGDAARYRPCNRRVAQTG